MNIEHIQIGERIRKARLAKQMKQSDLDIDAELPRTAISKIELGNRGITTSELVRIARALGTPVDSLTGNNESFIYNEEIKIVEALREIPFEDYKRILTMLEASVYYTAKDSDEIKKIQLQDLVSNLAAFTKFDQRPRPIQKSTLETKTIKNRQLH
ncbi:helix-turn-helix transcriptional regulator [Bacteriovorax sp. PP10]|uniref:Helix-turn-helix transcriptional regulator n=1 Tax=Bacteriovorax antarcticus TaxID=3088717 RepID=A0ABU5VZH6_9BACT|nr:helix-turn-helix transcriptional regulator [Bacteriovorax sp. PP10]MEA9358459.1 helix-turn-helix transcriptional regulator [Bacteriovorax sp. PP10]